VRTVRLLVAYDGTEFAGWQRQGSQRTVQGELETVLARIDHAPVAVAAAGRTDAGVHAAGMVASARLAAPIPAATLLRALNANLPPDVRVLAVDDMPDGWHARFHAVSKTYRYWIWNGRVASPFARRYAWHVPQPLDVAAMAAAAPAVVGRHDFAAFKGQGSQARSTVRAVFASGIREVPAPEAWGGGAARVLCYEVTGAGFLRYMVRGIVGTLVRVGRGTLDPGALARIIEGRDRTAAGPTAPPEGLTLWHVGYEARAPRSAG
jgi:tRNA pseudouridine38-40 synthase